MTMIWQAPNSTVDGALQPRDEYMPFESTTLENWLQHWVAAIAHIDGELARPRWQPEGALLPDYDTPCWLTLGITKRRPLGIYAWVAHNGKEWPGYDHMQRHEEIDVLVSFYGPESDAFCTNFHSGLMIWQNTHMLRYVQMAFADVGESVHAPELIRERWWKRWDKPITLRRMIMRNYNVYSLRSFYGWVKSDQRLRYRAPLGYEASDDEEVSHND